MKSTVPSTPIPILPPTKRSFSVLNGCHKRRQLIAKLHSPAALIDPLIVIVLESPVPEMPLVLLPATAMLPAGPIGSVSLRFTSTVVGPCVVVSTVLIAASAASTNCCFIIKTVLRTTELTAYVAPFSRSLQFWASLIPWTAK